MSTIRHTLLLLSLLLAASCLRDKLPQGRDAEREEGVYVTFSIGEGTKATSVLPANESQVNRWTLFVFRSDGTLANYGTSSSSASITLAVKMEEAYTLAAVANHPASTDDFNPASFTTKTALDAWEPSLTDNSLTGLVMYGSKPYTLHASDAGTTSIPLDRVVSKVIIRKVSVSMSNPLDASLPFVLKHIYLLNVPDATRLGSDYPAASLPSGRSLWHNALGWHASGSIAATTASDALLGDRAINRTIANGGSYSVEHVFYATPNAAANAATEAWSPRATRLVIEATVNDETVYYPVPIPATARNSAYIIEEAVIHRYGNINPWTDTNNGTLTVTMYSQFRNWDAITVTEES